MSATPNNELIWRMRLGAQLTVRQAADKIPVSGGAVAQWEAGPVPRGRLQDAARAWARGKPTKHEQDPRYLVAYKLLDARYFLADDEHAIFVFIAPKSAGAAAARLADLGLEDVVLVPAWQSALRGLERQGAAMHVLEDGGDEDPLGAIATYLTQLSGEYALRFGAGASPP